MARTRDAKLQGLPLNLGEPVKVYRQNLLSQLLFPARILVWTAIAGLAGMMMFMIVENIGWDEPFDLFRGLSIAALMLGFIGWITFTTARKLGPLVLGWRDMAVEYPNGIAYFHQGVWREMGWEEISEVRRQEFSFNSEGWFGGDLASLVFVPMMMFLMGHMREYKVSGQRTGPISICGTLAAVVDLMDTIQGHTLDRRRQHALTVLQNGAEVAFGKVAIHTDKGVRRGSTWHPWREVSVVDDTIIIKSGRWPIPITTKIAANGLPNGDILLSVVLDRRRWIHPRDPISEPSASSQSRLF